jgi:hypothetical protein
VDSFANKPENFKELAKLMTRAHSSITWTPIIPEVC